MKIDFKLILIVFFLANCSKEEVIPEKIQNQPDFISEAGMDFLDVKEFQVQLNANNLLPGEKGTWRIISGLIDDKVSFQKQDNPKSIFYGLPGETYLLEWEVSFQGSTLKDSLSVSFERLQTEIINLSPNFYSTRLLLLGKSYDSGIWTVEGDYHRITNQYISGYINNEAESPYIKFETGENTTNKLTWTTYYGSKSASTTININSGDFHEDEALEDLHVFDQPDSYKKDIDGHVSYLNFNQSWYGQLFEEFEQYPALKSLKHLKWLNLTSQRLYTFPKVIADYYNKLEYLDVSYNGISSLPENIGNLVELDTLILYNNQYGQELPSLPNSFGDLKSLKYLDLSDMYVKNIPESFGNLTNLVFLNLENNVIEKLPDTFGNLTNLKTLRGPWILQEVPASFSKLEALEFCFLSVYKDGATYLPSDFGNLSNLETFYFGGSLGAIPANFGNLKKLKDLQLVLAENIIELPPSFGDLEGLESLRITGNFKQLPNEFINLSNLKFLEIQGALEELPTNFGQLKNLEYLNLSNLHLQELPDSFGQLESLSQFIAASNKITFLPDSFGNLQSINILDLSYNLLTGFPSTTNNLSGTLFDIIIRGNNFSEEELNNLREMLPAARITVY